MQELENPKKSLLDSLSDYFFSLNKDLAKNIINYAMSACDTYSNKTIEEAKHRMIGWNSNIRKSTEGFYDILADHGIPYVFYLSNLNKLLDHLRSKGCYIKVTESSVEIKNCLNDRLFALFSIVNGDMVTVSCQLALSDFDRVENKKELIDEIIDKFINTIHKNKLVLFSDASSARTFSSLEKIADKKLFVYLVTGVRNPNTGNKMDVATTIDSIRNYNSIPPSKRYTYNMPQEFYGLCGGSIASLIRPVSLNELVVRNSFLRKRGLIIVAYKEVPENFSGNKDNAPVHPDLKNVFVIKTSF